MTIKFFSIRNEKEPKFESKVKLSAPLQGTFVDRVVERFNCAYKVAEVDFDRKNNESQKGKR